MLPRMLASILYTACTSGCAAIGHSEDALQWRGFEQTCHSSSTIQGMSGVPGCFEVLER